MTGNDFVSWVLRSPFHGMLSNGMMLITVTGCRTGRKYTTPVGYFLWDGYFWIVTSRNRTWWKNLRNGAEVSLLLKRKCMTAFAEPELDVEMVESRMREYLRHFPRAAKPMGIQIENGNANARDIARVSRDRLFVRVQQST